MDALDLHVKALRRQMRFLWGYAVIISVALIVVVIMFLRPGNRFKELSAEKINIIEKDGTVKLSLFNQQNLPPAVINGVKLPRSGDPASGLMFYNTQGEECGGLIYSSSVD